MTTRTNQRPKWPFHVIATVVVLVLAALALPVASNATKHNADAHKHKVDGVRAKVKHGTLEVKGSQQADAVALRVKAGDPNQIQVDVDDDGSADFSFERNAVAAINVKMGNGDDSVRVDDANGG